MQIVERLEGDGASQQGTAGVAHDHPQPWAHGRRVADVAHAPERGHGRVLDHVVDVGSRSQNAHRDRAHTCPVPFEEQTQCSHITCLRGTREHRVLEVSGLARVRAQGVPPPLSVVRSTVLRAARRRHGGPTGRGQYTSRTYRFSAASCLTYAVAPSSSRPPWTVAMLRRAWSTSLAMREASPHT